MGIFSFFTRNKNKPLPKYLLDRYGFENTVNVLAKILLFKCNQNEAGQLRELASQKDLEFTFPRLTQFIREEADAMRIAGGASAKLARNLFDGNESAYRGALTEDSDTPIDYPGGPQQTLLVWTKELAQWEDMDFVSRWRCAIVQKLAHWQEFLIYAINSDLIPSSEEPKWVQSPQFEKEKAITDQILLDISKMLP